jgi:hypothetical protein
METFRADTGEAAIRTQPSRPLEPIPASVRESRSEPADSEPHDASSIGVWILGGGVLAIILMIVIGGAWFLFSVRRAVMVAEMEMAAEIDMVKEEALRAETKVEVAPEPAPEPVTPKRVEPEVVPDWKEYVSPDGKFAVSFPGKPDVRKTQVSFLLDTGTIVAIEHVDGIEVPKGKSAEAFLEEWARTTFGKEAVLKATNVHGFLALDGTPGRSPSVKLRIILVRDRIYQLNVQPEADDRFDAALVSRFFDSFRLIEKK